jgi:hypothetical protein
LPKSAAVEIRIAEEEGGRHAGFAGVGFVG